MISGADPRTGYASAFDAAGTLMQINIHRYHGRRSRARHPFSANFPPAIETLKATAIIEVAAVEGTFTLPAFTQAAWADFARVIGLAPGSCDVAVRDPAAAETETGNAHNRLIQIKPRSGLRG